MARGPGKARDFDYSNLGTTGRRTGLTLKEGRRDEHGMESVDGLFSSPEKSPARLNGFDDAENEDSMGSDMSIDEGNAPGPMDFLNPPKDPRSPFLPPPSQSPAKGAARSSRRSPVIQSSPEPEEDLSPSPSDGRSATKSNSRKDPAPLSARSANAGPKNQKNNARQKMMDESIVSEFSDAEGDENADSFAPVDDRFDDSVSAGDETMIPEEDLPELSDEEADEAGADPVPVAESSPRTGKTAKSTKKAPATKPTKENDGKPQSGPGRRGRPKKSERPADDASSEPRPAKKQKVSANESRPREPLDPELDRVVENYSQRTGPLKGRSLHILKRENPADNAYTHTRSGRASVRPLAYWRNERCVYGSGEVAEGHRFPLSTIKEIIRTEELEPEKKPKNKRAGRKPKSKKPKRDESSDEEDPNLDEWEKQEGILHGIVPKWDNKTQTHSTEEEVIDVAYAPSGIQTREVKGSSFRFAKLLSSSFIGSGVVELPPNGVKRPKNSKKMHMVFFVCHGRVQVDISDVKFSAGKGCVFQVPRGNYYSFANPYDKEARLFFTQGCVPDESDQPDKSPSAEGKPMQDSEFETDAGPSEKTTKQAKPTKARGRPKGKEKADK